MTTTVKIKTVSWPVKMTALPLRNREPIDAPHTHTRVEPYSEQEFVVHDGQDLHIHELPEEKAAG